MVNITGIHVFQSVRKEYSEHILLIQAISALEWKMKNGPIHLYTTKRDLTFFEKIGIDKLYDEIDTDVLEEKDEINWQHFFSASKIKVLKSIEKIPVAFIDTDFIMWQELPETVKSYDISYMYREGLFWRNYPPLAFLGKREGYEFPKVKELEISKPINAGFFVMNNEQLRKRYVELAYDYMKGNDAKCKEVEWADEGLRMFWKSLFVEQRLLGALVDENYTNKQIFSFDYYGDTLTWQAKKGGTHLSQDEINSTKDVPFFHLYGEKSLYGRKEGKMLSVISFYNFLNYFMDSGDDNLVRLALNVIGYVAFRDKRDFYNIQSYLKLK